MDLRPGVQNVMKLASYELNKSEGKSIIDLLKDFDSGIRVELALKKLMEISSVNDYITRYGLYDLVYEELNYIAKKNIPQLNKSSVDAEILDIPFAKEQKVFNPTEVVIEGDEDIDLVDTPSITEQPSEDLSSSKKEDQEIIPEELVQEPAAEDIDKKKKIVIEDIGKTDEFKPLEEDGFEFKAELSEELLKRINERNNKTIVEDETVPKEPEEVVEPDSLNANGLSEEEIIDNMAELLLSQIQSVKVVERKGMYK